MNKYFDAIVAELIYKEMRIRGLKYLDVATIINKREDYVRKIHSRSSEKRYNLEHLYLLSQAWEMQVSSFLPSIENLAELPEFTTRSKDELIKIMGEIVQELRGGYDDE